MNFNVSQLKTDLSRRLAPSSPDDSKDFYGAVEASARNLLAMIKPKELSRRAIIENALYDQINRYSSPEDLDTNKIMQWYRLKGNQNTDRFYTWATQVSNRSFDASCVEQTGWGNPSGDGLSLFTVEYQSGKKFIKVRDGLPNSGLTLNEMNNLTENGTWNTFGNVVNLTSDNLTYVAGDGSLRFDINTSSTTGGLEVLNMDTVDIEDYLNVGKVFTWLDLPNATQIQTITLDLFSSATDYYSITVNSPHDTSSFQVGQNMLGFTLDQDSMNTIGTPDPKAINQMRFTFVTNGTLYLQSVRLDNVVARKGHVYGLQYISNQMFNDPVSGYWKFRPTQDSDIIHLEYDSYSLLLDFATYELGNELLTDTAGRNNVLLYKQQLNENIREYKKRHKEEFIDETQTLRNFGVPYGYYGGRGYNSGFGPMNRNS